MNAHFIDLDTIIISDQKSWVVSKENPKNPLLRIENWEFNLFKSGIYKDQNNKIDFNGSTFYVSDDFMERLKNVCRKHKVDIGNLAISMIEFIDPEKIEESNFELDMSIFNPIVNKPDHIYFFASKNKENGYGKIAKKLTEKMLDLGLQITDIYYLSETFYNRMDDEISYQKIKILLQYLVGHKTEGNCFTDQEITEYENIYYYDQDYKPLNLAEKINEVLEKFLINSDEIQSKVIKSNLRNVEKKLIIREVTPNKGGKFIEKIITLQPSNVIKSFENFKWK